GEIQQIDLGGSTYNLEIKTIQDGSSEFSAAKFSINGETTITLNKGSSDTLTDGSILTVTEIIPNEAGDSPEDIVIFTLNAEELIMEEQETRSVNINGTDYDIEEVLIADGGGSYTTSSPIISALFYVNGERTLFLKDGDSDILADGTEIFVTDIIPNEAGDVTSDLVEFTFGGNKFELKDTDITDREFTNYVKYNGDTIISEEVVITGDMDTSQEFVKIEQIIINNTAGDNYYVEQWETLTEQMDENGFIFGNIDIAYEGLTSADIEMIEVTTSGSDQYNLKFEDGAGLLVTLPIVSTNVTNSLKLGDDDYDLVLNEGLKISKNDYLILSDYSQSRGNRGTYALRYLGASKNSSDFKTIKFKNLGTGATIEQTYNFSSYNDGIVNLTLGGHQYEVFANSSVNSTNFDIKIDLNGDGILGGYLMSNVDITTNSGAEISIGRGIFGTPDQIGLNITTPNPDDYEDIMPSKIQFNIVAASGEVQMNDVGPLNYISPPGDSNVNLALNSLGAAITWHNPIANPDTLLVEYPKQQRTPQVYIKSK
ncbi:MAG: hypothetical protein ABII01_04710, partial [Candidatus Woesearchaeota archaeon]